MEPDKGFRGFPTQLIAWLDLEVLLVLSVKMVAGRIGQGLRRRREAFWCPA
jgi:hypothetical protein